MLTYRTAEAETALTNQEWQQPGQIKRLCHNEIPFMVERYVVKVLKTLECLEPSIITNAGSVLWQKIKSGKTSVG